MANYTPIPSTPILSNLCDRLVSVYLKRFFECRNVLPTSQFTYRKCFRTCVRLLCVVEVPTQKAPSLGVFWRGGRRQKNFRSTSVLLLTGSTLGDFLQALRSGSLRFCAVCSDSFSLIGQKMSWWLVVGAKYRSIADRQPF